MISIITATYNAAANLRHCFASIAAQTMPCERIVIDGGSRDETLAIIDEHRADIAHVVSEPDNGIYDALNKGIRKATGGIIGILHADDFYLSPDILVKVAKVFEDPAVEACYGDLVYVRETEESKKRDQLPVTSDQWPSGKGLTSHESRVTSHGFPESRVTDHDFKIVRYWHSGPFSPDRFNWGWMPPHPTFFVRRSVYEKYGLFRLDLGTAADYELMLRFLLKHSIHCVYIPEVLVCMRVGGASNRSLAARLKANRMDHKAWEVNGLRPYPWTIAMKPLRKIPQWWRRPQWLIPGP